MSSATHRPVDTLIAPQPTLAVAWSIARQAVREALPDLELPPVRRRHGGDVVLSVSITGQSMAAELRDTQTGESHPIEIGSVNVERVRAGEFEHIAVTLAEQQMLSATTRCDASETRLIYARTALFERLGIRGGRYTRPTLD
ncbi:MAG: hypothetical protein AAGJ54_09255 [Planctomycetota bacterium]